MAQKTITVRIPEADLRSGGTAWTNFDICKKLKNEGIPAFYNSNRNRMAVDYGKLEYWFDYVTDEAVYTWTGEVPEAKKDDSVYASPVAQMILDAVKHERIELFELLKQAIPHLRRRYTSLQMCLIVADTPALQMECQRVKALLVQIKAAVDNFSKEEGEKQ